MQFIGIANYLYAGESCYICHRNEGLVDTGTYIEGEGALAICSVCIKEMARTAGMGLMIDQQVAVDDLTAHNEQLLERTMLSEAQYETLLERFAALQAEWVSAVESQQSKS